MKKLLFLVMLFATMVGCKSDEPQSTNNKGFLIDEALSTIELSGSEEPTTISFTAYEAWDITAPSSIFTWCTVAPRKGNAGKVTVTITPKENTTDAPREFTMTLKAGEMSREIKVTQPEASQIVLNNEYKVLPEGGRFEIEVKTNVDFTATVRKSDAGWLKVAGVETGGTRALDTKILVLDISAMPASTERRDGKITLSAGSTTKEVTITQVYESTDFSADGTVVTLNKSSVETSKIQVILMGDAFSDRQIANGTYEKQMKAAMEAIFWLEPYKTYRELFNVYYVNVVSKNEGYFNGSETALEGKFDPESTIVSGKDERCYQYAQKIPNIDMDQVMVVVLMNKKAYGGTNYPSYPKGRGDYGIGRSLAYFPLGNNEDEFRTILCHEVCGHGIAKLGDEYFYSYSPDATTEQKNLLAANSRDYGWNKNLDITSDPSVIKWKHFLNDSRYTGKVGVFEGGNICKKGIYRPSDDSMMNNNLPFFNAPSREAIYYRIHKLAYGESWVYDYNKFVEYDQINREAEVKAKLSTRIPYDYPRLPSPIIRD